MAELLTFGELYKRKDITEDDLVAAVEAFMADPSLSPFPIGEGYTVDPHAAVSESPFALGLMANPDAKPASKRAAVRTAILLARPTKG